MRKQKLTPEQREEKYWKIRSIAIETLLWIIGLTIATMLIMAGIVAIDGMIELLTRG